MADLGAPILTIHLLASSAALTRPNLFLNQSPREPQCADSLPQIPSPPHYTRQARPGISGHPSTKMYRHPSLSGRHLAQEHAPLRLCVNLYAGVGVSSLSRFSSLALFVDRGEERGFSLCVVKGENVGEEIQMTCVSSVKSPPHSRIDTHVRLQSRDL